nr:hypothetical protein [Tanacetum cinerariifolium]
MQNAVNSLRSENESLKSHYSMSCARYSGIFSDLARAKGLEANLSRKVSALEREKLALRHDLDWVIKKSIPRMLARVVSRLIVGWGFKKTKWECMESLTSSSDLSLSLLHSVLDRGDSGAGEGSSSRPAA